MTKANAGYVAKADRAGGGATEETEVKKEGQKAKAKHEAKEAKQEAKQEGGKKRKQAVKEPEAEVEQVGLRIARSLVLSSVVPAYCAFPERSAPMCRRSRRSQRGSESRRWRRLSGSSRCAA